MPLPKEKTKPSLKNLSMLIYGAPKIGKSTFCSKIPEALFIATEPGLNMLEVYRVDCNSWLDILNALAELKNTNHNFKTLVIDTVDRACKFCCEFIVDRYNKTQSAKVSDISEIPFGKGYKQLEAEFNRVINRLFELNMTLIFTSHELMAKVSTTGGDVTKLMPSLDERCRNILLPYCDIIMRIEAVPTLNEKGENIILRQIKCLPSPYYEAGDRTKRLSDNMIFDYDEIFKRFK